MNNRPILGIIGGSGLYEFTALKDVETIEIDTPFGKPSSPIVIGTLSGNKVAFLARHGIGHFLSPTEVNYRANIFAFKKLGIQCLIGISACGSLREDYAPGHIVVPDQLVDNTKDRARTFFTDGLVVHVGVAEPFCPELSRLLYSAVAEAGATVHSGGTLITIEGPRFSTKAESNMYRSEGISLVGMTACPEAFLAREAELCYTTMAHVTDYDVWHVTEEPVSVDMVVRTLAKNTQMAQLAIQKLVEIMPEEMTCSCSNALANAIITRPECVPPETCERVKLLIGKYLES
ncbi:methylthioadenosine phosphorylase [Longilinea arvoryzae]|uniref:S-methyl-5'-thioadenosine phosphorylase n=1 Tax=Longilinea arvoryzae TaxID=360412 RepID=A0A0S7BBG5_9CHLR|nr:S-methyl-5'-thioadenosine phosphorylase [Longilinea arvoryzae]GAP15132.1 methylthioadenosine phosphorylase [Longilinea arvoryzae]